MSLFNKVRIIYNSYIKNAKKSIHSSGRIDVFLILALFILIISPFLINIFIGLNTTNMIKDLYVSPRFIEFFGEEIAESLVLEFEEQRQNLRLSFPDDPEIEPDILFFEKSEIGGLVADGILQPFYIINIEETDVDNDVENGGDDYIEQHFAVPLVSFMDLLFYNIDLLKAAGFERPPKTRAEFLSFARTVTNSNDGILAGAWGTAMGLSPLDKRSVSRDIFSWIWASGNNFWSGENPTINNRIILRDITYLGSLNREGVLMPRSFEATEDQRLEEFANGKIALMIASTRVIPALRELMGDDAFGITTIPESDSGGRYSIGLSGIYTGINAECEHYEEALNFILYLLEKRSLFSAELKAIPGDVTAILSADNIEYIGDDPFYSKALDIFQSAEIVGGFSETPGGEKFENIVREEFQIFFDTNRTPQATAIAIQERWDEEREP